MTEQTIESYVCEVVPDPTDLRRATLAQAMWKVLEERRRALDFDQPFDRLILEWAHADAERHEAYEVYRRANHKAEAAWRKWLDTLPKGPPMRKKVS